MTFPASRAGALAAIGLLSVLVPVIGTGMAVFFAVLGVLAFSIPEGTRTFERLATVADRRDGRLRTLPGTLLAVAVLALLGTVDAFDLPVILVTMTVVLITFGHVGGLLAHHHRNDPFARIIGFTTVGTASSLCVYQGLVSTGVAAPFGAGAALVLATVGALAAGLYRTELERRDPLVLVSVGLLLWFLAAIVGDPSMRYAAVLVGVTGVLGLLAYGTATASVAGMLSGMLLAMITVAFGGFAWLVPLVAFFVVGGLATKFRYEEKAARGVAEGEEGARGTANVMSNGFVPLLIVVAWAAFGTFDGDVIPEEAFVLAFAGAVATALADTLASEFGALFDAPRMITSFERVRPGTDGAVTLEGHLAGITGAGVIGGLVFLVFPQVGVGATLVIVLAGVIGMSADSMFGATLEGVIVGNDGVNLLATCVGSVVASGGALLVL